MIEDSINNLASAINRLADALGNKTDVTQDARLAALESKTAALSTQEEVILNNGGVLITYHKGQEPQQEEAPAPAPPAEPEKQPGQKEITHDDLRALAKRLIEKDGNPKRFKAYLKDTHGVETLSHIPYADLDAAAAGITNLIES